jgi:hypothetical protein
MSPLQSSLTAKNYALRLKKSETATHSRQQYAAPQFQLSLPRREIFSLVQMSSFDGQHSGEAVISKRDSGGSHAKMLGLHVDGCAEEDITRLTSCNRCGSCSKSYFSYDLTRSASSGVHRTAVAVFARVRKTTMSSKTYAPVPSSTEISASPEKQDRDHTPRQLRQQHSKRFPDKTTILLILIAFICLVGCIIIVYCANGRVVSGWRVQPTVLVAFFSAIFSFCIKLVFSSGVANVWWRALEEDNASLQDLHHIWKRGIGESIGNVGRALSCRKARLVLAAFTVITVVDFADGPLLQRSIRIGLSSHKTQFESVWQIAANIAEGWTGSIDQTGPAGLLSSLDMSWALQEWHSNRSMASPQDCGGKCDGAVVAAGIEVNCSSSTRYLDLTEPKTVNTTVFDISFQRSLDSNGSPVLGMTHVSMNKVDEHCNGTIGTTTCSIRTATVEYNVHQDGYYLWLPFGYGFPRPLSAFPSSGDRPGPDGTPAGALAALEFFGFYYLRSNSVLLPYSVGNYEDTGLLAMEFVDYESSAKSNQSCVLQWKNATDILLWNLHDVMFRMALKSSTGTLIMDRA